MPATAITPTTIPTKYATSGDAITWANCDSVNGNEVAASDSLVLLFRNTNASAQTINITSQPDPVYGRTGNVAYSLAAGATRVFHVTRAGWQNTDGKIAFSSHADVLVAAIIVQ